MSAPTTPRERYRDEVRAQIKRLANTQLAELGPAGLSLSAMARELGMSAPALYRYFASRDALLTELVVDAYDDLADALEAAVSSGPSSAGPPLRRVLTAYRAWALAYPHRFRLLFQPPVPGFDSNDPILVTAAGRSMTILLRAIAASPASAPVGSPPEPLPAQSSAGAVAQDPPPEATLRGVLVWSRVHGFVSLEIANSFALAAQDSDALFAIELDSISPVQPA